MTAERNRRYHEAAHACLAAEYGRIDTVSVVGGEHWGGLTLWSVPPAPPEVAAEYAALVTELAQLKAEEAAQGTPPKPSLWPPYNRANVEQQMLISLAGKAAEELLGFDGYVEETPDEAAAEAMAAELAVNSPRHTELLAKYDAGVPDDTKAMAQARELCGDEAMAHYQLMRQVARRMVAERWPQVHALAEALRTRPILDGPTAELILKTARACQAGGSL